MPSDSLPVSLGVQDTDQAHIAGDATRDVAHAVVGDVVADVQTMPLYAEQAVVSKRVRKTRVRVVRSTRTRDEAVETDLNHDQVVVERVAIGRVVDAMPEIRQEGDTTILPVVEEVVVVERRLVLKEEVHVRRVRTTQRHVETVTLREQQATVTRTEIED